MQIIDPPQTIKHKARIVTYVDTKEGKSKLIPLLTNDTDMDPQEIVDIYRKRWEIELLFKQLKQNFPLRYFYGQSANAILGIAHSQSPADGHPKAD